MIKIFQQKKNHKKGGDIFGYFIDFTYFCNRKVLWFSNEGLDYVQNVIYITQGGEPPYILVDA